MTTDPTPIYDRNKRAEQRSPRILLVEDQPEQLVLRGRLLGAMGVEVVGVASVEEALESLRNRAFDVVVTDINLGSSPNDQSGVHLAEIVHDEHPSTPIVAYSALFESHDLKPDSVGLFIKFFEKASRSGDVANSLESIAELARSERDRSPDA